MKYLFILTAACTMLSCRQHKNENVSTEKFCLSDTMKQMIAIDTVNYCNINNRIQLSGAIHFNENKVIKIFPRSSGQVIESNVSFGDKVTAGQVLAVIKSAEVAGNYQDLSGAQADINIAKREMDNEESLYKSGIASEREYTEAKENYDKAVAAKRKIESVININGGSRSLENGTYLITSPITGYIVEKNINAGNFIRPDMSGNLFTISDLKDVWVTANVFEQDIAKIHTGNEVQVITLAYPDKIFTGKVDKIGNTLDPANKTMQVRIALQNTGLLLKPEMFATVIVSDTTNQRAICIPTKALISQDEKNYVIIYNSDCDLKVAEVNIIKTVGDKTYITAGAQPGQKVITENELLIFQQLMNE